METDSLSTIMAKNNLDATLKSLKGHDQRLQNIENAIRSLNESIKEIREVAIDIEEIKTTKNHIDKNITQLSKLNVLEEKLKFIDQEMKKADTWLEKAPKIEERLAVNEEKSLSIRAVAEDQLQKTTAYKIIKNSTPAILLLGIGIIAGGVTFGGYQINSVMETSAQANKQINEIRDDFRKNLNAQIQESTTELTKALKNIEIDANGTYENVKKTESDVNTIAKRIRKQDQLINDAVDDKLNSRLSKYKKDFDKLGNDLIKSNQAITAITKNKDTATSVLDDIAGIKNRASSQLKQQNEEIKTAVEKQTVAYFNEKFEISDIKNIGDIDQRIGKLDTRLNGLEQRVFGLSRYYFEILSITVAAIALILSFVALKKAK